MCVWWRGGDGAREEKMENERWDMGGCVGKSPLFVASFFCARFGNLNCLKKHTSWNVFPWECIGCIGDEETGLTDCTIADYGVIGGVIGWV